MNFLDEQNEVICPHRKTLILNALLQIEELRRLLHAATHLSDIFRVELLNERLALLVNDFAISSVDNGKIIPSIIREAVIEDLEMNPISLVEVDEVLQASFATTSLANVRSCHP